MYKNKVCVALWPLYQHQKSGRTSDPEIPTTHRSFYGTAYLGHLACLKNLAQGHGQCAEGGTKYGWRALCPGKALTHPFLLRWALEPPMGTFLGCSLQFESFC